MILDEKLFTKLFIHFSKLFIFVFIEKVSQNFYFKNCAQNFVYIF
jgi:hypothetical protein